MDRHFCVCQLKEATLVVTRRPITDLPRWVQYLLRWVFFRYHWAASNDGQNPTDTYYSTHYRGLFIDEAKGRWRANEAGGSITVVPFDRLLPEEPCHYKVHDFPQSEASHRYRNGRSDPVTIERWELAMLGRKIEEVETCAAGQCKQ